MPYRESGVVCRGHAVYGVRHGVGARVGITMPCTQHQEVTPVDSTTNTMYRMLKGFKYGYQYGSICHVYWNREEAHK